MSKSHVNTVNELSREQHDALKKDMEITEKKDIQIIEMNEFTSQDTIKDTNESDSEITINIREDSKITTNTQEDNVSLNTSDKTLLLSNRTYDLDLSSGEIINLNSSIDRLSKDLNPAEALNFREKILSGDFAGAALDIDGPFNIAEHQQVLNEFVESVEGLRARADAISMTIKNIEKNFGELPINEKKINAFSDSIEYLEEYSESVKRLQRDYNVTLSDENLLDDIGSTAELQWSAGENPVRGVDMSITSLSENLSGSIRRIGSDFFRFSISTEDVLEEIVSEGMNFLYLGFNELLVNPTLDAISDKDRALVYGIGVKNGFIGPYPGLGAQVLSFTDSVVQNANPVSSIFNTVFSLFHSHGKSTLPPIEHGLEYAQTPRLLGTTQLFKAFKDIVSAPQLNIKKSNGEAYDLTKLPDQVHALYRIEQKSGYSINEAGNIVSAIYNSIVKPRMDAGNKKIDELKQIIHEAGTNFDEAKQQFLEIQANKIKIITLRTAKEARDDYNEELKDLYPDSASKDGLTIVGACKGILSLEAYQWFIDNSNILDDWAIDIVFKDIKDAKTKPILNLDILHSLFEQAFSDLSKNVELPYDMGIAQQSIKDGSFGEIIKTTLKDHKELFSWVPNETVAYRFNNEDSHREAEEEIKDAQDNNEEHHTDMHTVSHPSFITSEHETLY